MEHKVLVAYATKRGATAEIAEKIGEAIRNNDLNVDVLPVGQVKELEPYRAVVLGSAAYIGQWRKEAKKFIRDNENALSTLPVWLFSSGPTEEGDPVELMKGWLYPKSLQPVIDNIEPRDITVFHGVITREKLNFLEKWMLKTAKAPIGDFRDWEAIAAWANNIASELNQQTT
jgi:menaquinone-dependent protoporphyrinogen oxidase